MTHKVIDPSRGIAELFKIPNLSQLASLGLLPGGRNFIQIGESNGVDIGDPPTDVWDINTIKTYTIDTGAQYFFSSSSALDTQICSFVGLTVDGSGNWIEERFIFVLNGQTKTDLIVPSGNLPVRPWIIVNVDSTDLNGDVYLYEDSTVTAGVPDDVTKIQARMIPEHNKTMLSHFAIPSGKVAIILGAFVVSSKTTRTVAEVTFNVRSFGSVFLQAIHVLINAEDGDGRFTYPLASTGIFSERTDTKLSILTVTKNDSAVSSGVEYLILDKEIWRL